MEFSCRLGTASGEVIEEVHVAESESKLRQELEAKGLCILSLSRRGAFGWPGLSLPTRRRINTREFLVFNQELATLLRAGLPPGPRAVLQITSSTWRGAMPARVNAAVRMGAARSGSERCAKAPPRGVTGLRQAEMM